MKDQLNLFPRLELTGSEVRTYVTLYDELLNESALALQMAPDFPRREDLQEYLRDNLPQKSPNTRRINAYKIMERFFADVTLDIPLVHWWPHLSSATRRELLFYTIAGKERLVEDFVTQVLYPNLKKREFAVEVVRGYVAYKLLRVDTKSAERLLRLLKKSGWVTMSSGNICFQELDPTWPAVLYALHDEFGDGKHRRLSELQTSRTRRLFLLSDDRLQGILLRGWNEQYIIYDQRRRPEGFRLRNPLAKLTSGPVPGRPEGN